MRYFSVKNFDKFQHYKTNREDTAPVWIKVHRSLMTDFAFRALPDDAKGHLMLIWLLASQTKNWMPFDSKAIAPMIGAQSKIDLKELVDAGFLILESESGFTLECNTESTATKTHECGSSSSSPLLDLKETKNLKDAEEDDPNSPTTAEELMEGWNDVCVPHGLSAVRDLSASRRKQIGLRLKEHPLTDFWQEVINHICGSPFLLGTNDRGWKVNFDWLFENDTNALKVYEGRYDKEKIQSRNGIGRTA